MKLCWILNCQGFYTGGHDGEITIWKYLQYGVNTEILMFASNFFIFVEWITADHVVTIFAIQRKLCVSVLFAWARLQHVFLSSLFHWEQFPPVKSVVVVLSFRSELQCSWCSGGMLCSGVNVAMTWSGESSLENEFDRLCRWSSMMNLDFFFRDKKPWMRVNGLPPPFYFLISLFLFEIIRAELIIWAAYSVTSSIKETIQNNKLVSEQFIVIVLFYMTRL